MFASAHSHQIKLIHPPTFVGLVWFHLNQHSNEQHWHSANSIFFEAIIWRFYYFNVLMISFADLFVVVVVIPLPFLSHFDELYGYFRCYCHCYGYCYYCCFTWIKNKEWEKENHINYSVLKCIRWHFFRLHKIWCCTLYRQPTTEQKPVESENYSEMCCCNFISSKHMKFMNAISYNTQKQSLHSSLCLSFPPF